MLLVAAGWLLTAVIATGAGIAVINLLGRPLAGGAGDVISARQAAEALATATVSPASPPPSPAPSAPTPSAPTPSPSTASPTPDDTGSATPEATETPRPETTSAAPAKSKVITTRGGSVVARCVGREVTLRSWSPAQGYEIDDVDAGPDDDAKVKFERDDDEVEIEIRCAASGPVYTVQYG